MPVDLYQWEAGGGLGRSPHRRQDPDVWVSTSSGASGTILNSSRKASRKGKNHRKTLADIYIGTSGQCAPCHNSDETHQRRHRKIAELVHKLDLLNSSATPTKTPAGITPLTPCSSDTLQDAGTSPMTKKERKAARKAKKISELPKALNANDVERIGKVLHPNDSSVGGGEVEIAILEDNDIKNNVFFHKGTSNKREIRREFVKKDAKGYKVVMRVEAEEMEGLLQLLNVSPLTASSSPEAKKLVAQLKQKIEADLVQAQEEMEGIMMRKAGFWRWASKKAYNRLVANGDIWEKKGEDFSVGKRDESVGSTEGDAIFSTGSGDGTDDTNLTEPDTDGTTAMEDEAVDGVSALKLEAPTTSNAQKTPKTPKTFAVSAEDDGWTAVGGSKAAKNKKSSTPKMSVKLSSNGGLAKIVQSSTPRTPGFLRYHSQDA